MEDQIVLRPPWPARVYIALFGLVWVGFLGGSVVIGLRHGPNGLMSIPAAMMVFGGVIISANLRLRVVADPAELRVRNFVREQRFRRSNIVGFVDHTPGGMPPVMGSMIAVLLDDGRLFDLRVTGRGPFGRSHGDKDLLRLRAWLNS